MQIGLHDLALHKLIANSMSSVDTAKALEYIEKLESNYIDSYYFPFALKIKADTYLNRNISEEAVKLYRTLLSDFPNYPFTDEIRKKLRELEEDQGSA